MKLKLGDILIALETVVDEDWKTAVAKQKESIPKGAEVKYAGSFSNYYGNWWQVKYNGCLYYVNPEDFKKKELEE